ncbi:MAG: hypothetical protein RL550_1872, partial [Actinomycetota bacterium]
KPHPTDPYNKVGIPLGEAQLAAHDAWRDKGILALVGMGIEPGLSDVFARYAADVLFDTIDEIGVRDGSNLSIDGYEFAPTFSIWTTIEECLNPPIIWEKDRGLYTTDCFSEPEIFHFPAGIGPVECVNVEHEEVLLIPREVDCNRVTFKYGLGAEFIDFLKTFAYLGLDSVEPVRVGDVSVAPRDVLAAVLPNPAKLGHLMTGKTCAGIWVKGTYDGNPREVYLYHVADNDTTMREWGSQAVLWQTGSIRRGAISQLARRIRSASRHGRDGATSVARTQVHRSAGLGPSGSPSATALNQRERSSSYNNTPPPRRTQRPAPAWTKYGSSRLRYQSPERR